MTDKGIRYRYFWFSFALAFLFLSLMLLCLMSFLHPRTPRTLEKKMEQAALAAAEHYMPSPDDAITVLFIGTSSRQNAADTYILARFDPVSGRIPIVVFPPQTLVEGTARRETLADVYRYGGSGYARKSLESALGVPIDRYVRFSEDAFITAADIVGTVEFDLPDSLTLGDEGIQVTMRAGKQLLDGKKAAAILSHNGYEGGEPGRCAVVGGLTAQIVNQRIDVVLSTLIDKIFEKIVNVADTDISYPDYESRKQAAVFLARLGREPAEVLETGGKFNAEGTEYTLGDTFLVRLQQLFL